VARLVVLDAGVLIALLDSRDLHHTWALDVFRDTLEDQLALSSLTYAEVLVHPSRAGMLEQVSEGLVGLRLDIHALSAGDAKSLALLRAQTGLRMPDVVCLELATRLSANLATTDNRLASEAARQSVPVIAPRSR
jgi:predicted nucleic acid-binding protein